MSKLHFKPLYEASTGDIIALMNNDLVGRHMPLLGARFSETDCEAFLKAKKKLWDDFGYGPVAFFIDGVFAGWGGLQPERGETDFALVLHPDYWGWGRAIFEKIKKQAFGEMRLSSITVLFPPGRRNAKAILRAGFAEDGDLTIDGRVFRRFRLYRPLQPFRV